MAASKLDSVISLAKRRGFVFQAGEIYGGSRSAWDYGPLGVELKENIKRAWWQSMVSGREDVVGLDSSIILPKRDLRNRAGRPTLLLFKRLFEVVCPETFVATGALNEWVHKCLYVARSLPDPLGKNN